jgi:hypothetical protein
MAVLFETDKPAELLKEFNRRIKQTEPKGKITTWEISDDGKFYTHKSTEWRAKAWFGATVDAGKLRFNIYPSQGQAVSVTAYGYYHGHLIETFLNHFDNMFKVGAATASPTAPDKVK